MTDYSLEPPTRVELAQWQNPMKVTVDSPLWARKAAEQLGRYFKRECRFDFPPMEAAEQQGDEGFHPYEIYVFHERAHDLMEEDKPIVHRAIGACGFRCFDTAPGEARWELQWAWFHPYSRRRGHLSSLWPTFHARYGDFSVARPLSLAMEAFLRRRQGDDSL